MPTEDRRRLDKQRGSAPGRREARGQTHREALPWCPPHAAHELSLGHDQLLAEQTVLGDERSPTTEKIGGETRHEPNEISHGRSRNVTSTGTRTEFVARTRATTRSTARVLLAGDGGLRRGEIIGLDLADVDFKGGRFTPRRSVYWKKRVR